MLLGFEPLLLPQASAFGFTFYRGWNPDVGGVADLIAGENRVFAMDFTRALATGDRIAGASAEVALIAGTDAAPGDIQLLPPFWSGPRCWQRLGGGNQGFQTGATYRWTVTITTGFGDDIVAYAHLTVVPLN